VVPGRRIPLPKLREGHLLWTRSSNLHQLVGSLLETACLQGMALIVAVVS
jgi:hypothetical protein